MRAGAICAVLVIAFDNCPALLELERTGALIAKNAAETIRKVWMFLVFMRTPFLTTPTVLKLCRMQSVAQTLLAGGG
jgi:hypothetical protein